MKSLKNFLLLLPIVLGSASLRPSETLGNRIVHNNKDNGNQALLAYIGSVSGMYAYEHWNTGRDRYYHRRSV